MALIAPSRTTLFFSLIYTSSAVVPFGAPELHALLTRCRDRNGADGITGMLLYKDGNFLQLLEGDEATVRATFARVQRDPRHTQVTVLRDQGEDTRLFTEWSMGFLDFNNPEIRATPGFSPFMNERWMDDGYLGALPPRERLLRNFRRRM
jgi:hypothetical protein